MRGECPSFSPVDISKQLRRYCRRAVYTGRAIIESFKLNIIGVVIVFKRSCPTQTVVTFAMRNWYRSLRGVTLSLQWIPRRCRHFARKCFVGKF